MQVHSLRNFGPWERFSPREQDIIEGLLQAQSVKDIAAQLHLTVNTVKDYVKTIYQKAGVHSSRALLLKFYLPPAHDTGTPAALVAAFQAMLDAPSRRHVVEALREGARGGAGARYVAVYDLVAALASAPGAPRRTGAWLRPWGGRGPLALPWHWARPLSEQGSFHLPAPAPAQVAAMNWEPTGLRGEVIGAQVAAAPQPLLVLLSDPLAGHFEPSALALLRLLARVAERELIRIGAGLAAAAAN
ncbi:MAG: response regulator transcription factor [Terriglobales bacterium]